MGSVHVEGESQAIVQVVVMGILEGASTAIIFG
jgi:hypothetical protein